MKAWYELLASLTRYALETPSIIVDRFSKDSGNTKLVIHKDGEYMKVKDLADLVGLGVVLIMSPELNEQLQDGEAQRALTRDLSHLGYDDFDQVMQVLRDQRDTVVKPRDFQIWMEGWQATGEDQKAQLIATVNALSFKEACDKHYATLDKATKDYWKWDARTGKWFVYSCQLYDNETDARRFNG